MAIAKLSIDLEARLGQLEQDLSRANKTLDRFAASSKASMSKVEASLNAVDAKFKAFAISIAASLGAVAVAGISQKIAGLVDGLDALNDASAATGSTVENLSALEDIGARTGTSFETVTSALVKFNQQLAETSKPGSEAALIFERLGLNAKELRAIDPAEALQKTAQALGQFASDGDKARYVQALFGKSTKEVAKYLQELADVGKLNATVTTEQAREAEKFNNQLAQLAKNSTDFYRSIANDVLPVLNALIERLKLASAEFGGFGGAVSAGLKQAVRGETFGDAQKALDFYSARLKEIDAQMKGLGDIKEGDTGFLAAFGRGRLKQLQEYRAETEKFANLYRSILNSGGAGAGRGSAVPGAAAKPSLGDLPTKPGAGSGDRVTEYDRYLKQLQQQLERTNELTAAETLLAEIQSGRLGKIGVMQQEVLKGIAEEIDATKAAQKIAEERAKQKNKDYEDANAAARANEEAGRDRLRGLLDKTPTAIFEKQQKDIELLRDKLEQGIITTEQYGEAVATMFDRIGKAIDPLTESIDRITDSLANAVESFFLDGGKIGDVFKSLERDLTRLAIDELITKPLKDAFKNLLTSFAGSGGGSGGGLFGSILSGLFSGGFADGGFIPPGKWGMTGERGPEPVFGGRTGVTVQPNGSGRPVVINFAINGPATRQTQQQIAAAAARGVAMAGSRNN